MPGMGEIKSGVGELTNLKCTALAGAVPVLGPTAKVAAAPIGFVTSIPAYAEPVSADYDIIPLLSSGDRVPRTGLPGFEYQLVGIPDGLGAHANGDGTITVYMNHEFGNNAQHEPCFLQL